MMDSVRPGLHRPTAWRAVLIANVCYAAVQGGMLVALTRLTNPDEVGRYGLALALTTPVVVSSNLQLRNIVATDSTMSIRMNDVINVRLATVVFDLLVVAGVLAVCGYPAIVWTIAFAVLAAKEAESLSDACYGLFLRHGKNVWMARSLLLRGTGALLILVGVLALWGSSTVAYVAVFVLWLAFALASDVRRARSLGAPPSLSTTRQRSRRAIELVRTGLPLGLSSLLIAVIASVPRVILERSDGLSDLGTFTALSYIVTGLAVSVNAVAQLSVPRLSVAFARADMAACVREMRRLYIGAVGLGLVALAGGALFGGSALRVVFGPDYARDTALLRWILLAGVVTLTASVGSWILTGLHIWKPQALMLAVTAGIAISASLLFVPGHGAVGAAWATGLAMTAQTGMAVLLGARRVKRPYATVAPI